MDLQKRPLDSFSKCSVNVVNQSEPMDDKEEQLDNNEIDKDTDETIVQQFETMEENLNGAVEHVMSFNDN